MSTTNAATVDTNTLVSHTDDKGRTLSGMGADVEKLAETMERHAPPDPAITPPTGEPAGNQAASAAPKPSRGAQRFSDLTRERDDARGETAKEREARQAVEKERDELRKQLETRASPAAEPKKEPEPEKAVEPTRPKPREDEIGAKYATYADFAEDLADWKYEQRDAARAAAAPPQDVRKTVSDVLAEERALQRFHDTMGAAQDRGRKAYADFDILLNGEAGQRPIGKTPEESAERLEMIAHHPQSEHIQYAILKDAALGQRLQQSDAMTFGLIIAGLVPAAKPAAPAWTPPPAPHPSVGASTPTTAKTSTDVAKGGGNFDEYRHKRAAERGVKPRW